MKSDLDGLGPGTVDAVLSVARLGQFLSVGVVGAVCDNLVLVALVEFAGLRPVVAKLASAETAIVLMFVLNERVTFAESGAAGVVALLRRFLTSNLVRAGGAATALVTLSVLHGRFGVWYLLANVLGMGLGFGVNYVFETLVTWRVGR